MLICTKVEVVGEDGRTGPTKSDIGRGFPYLTTSSFVVFSDYESEVGILKQKRMSVAGMCIGVFKNVLSYKRWTAVKVG